MPRKNPAQRAADQAATASQTRPADAPAAPAIKTAPRAKFVTVGSKLPMHITLHVCEKITNRVVGQFGTAEEVSYRPHGKTYVIRGTAFPNGKLPKGFPKAPTLIEDDNGGYALTKNIPADFWAKWLEQNRDTDMVKNGMIKAQTDLDSLADDAAEHAKSSSGLGPINPEQDRDGKMLDPRVPKPITAKISDITNEPRSAA